MSNNVSSRAPWKRSACDRCRAQKLRCHRDENHSTETCLRCIKFQAECVTSKAKLTGRPPLRRQPSQHQRQQQLTPQQQQHPASGAPADNRSLHTTSSSESGSVTDVNTIGLDYNLSLDNFLEDIDNSNGDFVVPDELLDTSLHLHPTPSSMLPPPSLTADVNLIMQQQQPLAYDKFRMSIADSTMSARMDDADFLLSKLNYELSEQLYHIRSIPWDVQSTLRLTFSHHHHQHHHMGTSEDMELPELSPLARVSNSSVELEKLFIGLRIQGSADATSSTFGRPRTSASSSSARRCPSTTQLLTALSCYIQIVSIYDKIFSRVLDYLTKNSRASARFQQPPAAPKIFLGGLPIPPYQTLPGSLLVHLIEHQLQPIEHLMGLPDRYRVSSKSREGNINPTGSSSSSSGNTTDGVRGGDLDGLFGGQHSKVLLNAVIELGETQDSNTDSIQGIWSLKVKMQQIKDS